MGWGRGLINHNKTVNGDVSGKAKEKWEGDLINIATRC